jgi:hypothetical protein
MHQMIENKSVYVVEFDTMPELPITGLTDGELTYEILMNRIMAAPALASKRGTYAHALTNAIENGIITKPGKYGIHLVPGTNDYEIFNIIED